MGVFHPVFVAVDIFRCNCDDSDIMGCDQRPYFATDNDIMASVNHLPGVKHSTACIIKVSLSTRKW